MNEIKRYDSEINLSPTGGWVECADYQEAVAAERKRCREEEVEPAKKALDAVQEDLAIASERWRDSDAGPATVSLEPKDPDDLDVCMETQDHIRQVLAAVEKKMKELP